MKRLCNFIYSPISASLISALAAEFRAPRVLMSALGAEPAVICGSGRAALGTEFSVVHGAALTGPTACCRGLLGSAFRTELSAVHEQ